VHDLTGTPPELIPDELDLYNSALSIATTGHDIDGSLKPFLYCWLTRNPPLYAVAEYLTSLVFGNGPFGLRLPAALFGMATVASMYALTGELTRRRDLALACAALVAVQPIFVHFSRIAWEPASELPFLLAGAWFALRALSGVETRGSFDARALRELAASAVAFGLTSYTYMAGWFYAAALGLGALALHGKSFRSRRGAIVLVAFIGLWALISAPALDMWFFDDHTTSRTQRIATFAGGINLGSLGTFFANYIAHFRISYLATTGDPIPGVTWRYLAGFGAFYWWVLPLAALGLASVFHYVRSRGNALWLLLWLAVYPLGGALTNEGAPNAPRTLAGAPVFCVFAAIGVAVLFEFAALARGTARASLERTLRALCIVAPAISTALFAASYFTTYGALYPGAWDSGTRATFAAVRDRAADYDRACFAVRQASYGVDPLFRYYLGDTALAKFDDVISPECYLPGTLLVSDLPIVRPGFVTLVTVLEVGGGPFSALSGYPRPRAAVPAPSAAPLSQNAIPVNPKISVP
jgi:4-amino-4-deoxy-L-arabinose transferase-like glycosyltransferase